MANNIFDAPFNCGVGLIPFDRITEQDYEPAIERALAAHNAEIDAIVTIRSPPRWKTLWWRWNARAPCSNAC